MERFPIVSAFDSVGVLTTTIEHPFPSPRWKIGIDHSPTRVFENAIVVSGLLIPEVGDGCEYSLETSPGAATLVDRSFRSLVAESSASSVRATRPGGGRGTTETAPVTALLGADAAMRAIGLWRGERRDTPSPDRTMPARRTRLGRGILAAPGPWAHRRDPPPTYPARDGCRHRPRHSPDPRRPRRSRACLQRGSRCRQALGASRPQALRLLRRLSSPRPGWTGTFSPGSGPGPSRVHCTRRLRRVGRSHAG